MSMQLIAEAAANYAQKLSYKALYDLVESYPTDSVAEFVLDDAYMHVNSQNIETAKELIYHSATTEKQFKVDTLKNLLRERVVTVSFTKKNGDERVMLCTLNEGMIPQDQRPKGMSAERKQSETSISVWDLEANGWRSFIISNIKEVK